MARYGPLADQTPVTDAGHGHRRRTQPMCTAGYMARCRTRCFHQNRRRSTSTAGVTPVDLGRNSSPNGLRLRRDHGVPEGVSVENVPDMNVCKAADAAVRRSTTRTSSPPRLISTTTTRGDHKAHVYAG